MAANTKVKSAIFEPNSIPSPNEGIPSIAALRDMNVSGRMEIMAMIIKPMVYLERRKLSAKFPAYFVAIVAPLITMNNATIKMNMSLII